MDPELLDAVRHLVDDLAGGRIAEIEADGRAGRLTALELRTAIRDYGRTLLPLPDEAVRLIGVHPSKRDPSSCSLDVPLWTSEEGESDLTLSVIATREKRGYRLEISDLHVL